MSALDQWRDNGNPSDELLSSRDYRYLGRGKRERAFCKRRHALLWIEQLSDDQTNVPRSIFLKHLHLRSIQYVGFKALLYELPRPTPSCCHGALNQSGLRYALYFRFRHLTSERLQWIKN